MAAPMHLLMGCYDSSTEVGDRCHCPDHPDTRMTFSEKERLHRCPRRVCRYKNGYETAIAER